MQRNQHAGMTDHRRMFRCMLYPTSRIYLIKTGTFDDVLYQITAFIDLFCVLLRFETTMT